MAEINLLDVFRTCRIGSIEVGALKEHVKATLGEPEDWASDNPSDRTQPYTQAESPLWVYGGIEFYWNGTDGTLSSAAFKPHYLHWQKWATTVDRWIFRRYNGPSVKRLRSALKQESIPFQDTGFEICLFQHSSTKYRLETIPFPLVPPDYKDESLEVFGTLVLKSGVQVRYGDNNTIINVSLSGDWMIKGRERFIRWE